MPNLWVTILGRVWDENNPPGGEDDSPRIA